MALRDPGYLLLWTEQQEKLCDNLVCAADTAEFRNDLPMHYLLHHCHDLMQCCWFGSHTSWKPLFVQFATMEDRREIFFKQSNAHPLVSLWMHDALVTDYPCMSQAFEFIN